MTVNDYHRLELDKRYVFSTYTNRKFYGIIVTDMGHKNFFIVENKNIKTYNDASNKKDQNVLNQIMIPINLDIIVEWAEQQTR